MSLDLKYRQNGSLIARRSDGCLLLVRKPRKHHAWQFPQGGVEVGEDPHAAALREFQEEVGTDKVEIIGGERGQFQYDFPPNAEFPSYVTDKTNYAGQCVHIFLGNFLGGDSDIRLEPTELAEYRWVTVAELPSLIEDQRYLAIVTDIITNDR